MRTILVIEDEFVVADVLAKVLEDEGYCVFLASNGHRGMERLAEAVPDLVVLDFMMPLMDGAAVGRAMRDDPALARIPIIMMSVAPEAAVRERIDFYTAFLRKPFRMPAFVDLVARVLGR